MTVVTTKLKCKPCNLFFKDDGSIDTCPQCNNKLKQIRVHHVKVENVRVVSKMTKVGER